MRKIFKKKPTSGSIKGNNFMSNLSKDIKIFSGEFVQYTTRSWSTHAARFGKGKNYFVTLLYKRRGKFAKRLMHSGMAGITAFGVMVAPIVAQEFPGGEVDPWSEVTHETVLSATNTNTETIIADREYRDRVIEYVVKNGETLSLIAEKFGVSTDTIRWENDLKSRDSIKIGEALRILPVVGVSHKVKKGDTVYSIAKRYDIDPQGIVNYPFNSFVNDETFELAIGQTLMVPNGVVPSVKPWSPSTRTRQITPDAGTVVASGQFVWPTNGKLSQYFAWYHKGIDIANRAAPPILAADSGTVVLSGWIDNYGYGNRVIIDHGNGYKTLYAHMSRLYVVPGQTVKRGDQIGVMGNTGRSTGTHLHFEIIRNGAKLNPLNVLQ